MKELLSRLALPFRRSLRRRLPFVTSALIATVLSAFLWVAFQEVESALTQAGVARAQVAADQLANLMAESTRRRLRDLRQVARHTAIRVYLQDGRDRAAAVAQIALLAEGSRGQPPVELWDVHGHQVLTASAPASSSDSTTPPALPPGAPSIAGVSGFQEWNGTLYWEAVEEIRTENVSTGSESSPPALIGYIRSRRLLSTTASSSDVIARLVGSGAIVKVGNHAGDIWSDLTKAVAAPPMNNERGGAAQYVAADGEVRLGAGARISETPWAVWVDFPSSVVTAPARVFLTRMLAFGLAFIVAAAVAVRILSERITKPLITLTTAAESIAAGTLEKSVEIRRPDEIGRLGAAFNEMAEQVRSVRHELEDRVRQRTARLAQADERTKAILRTANDAFIGMAADGRIVDWNAQAETVFGWSAAEAIGRSVGETIVPERHRAGFANYLRTGEPRVLNKRLELIALRRNGDEFPVEITIWASRTGDEQMFHAFARDITDRKHAEKVVNDAKALAERANRAKSEFVSRMSHDMRTPLNAILGFTQLLAGDNLRPEQQESVQLIQRGGKHLLSLVDEILDLARIESGQLSLSPESVDLCEVVRHAVELIQPLANEYNVTVQIQTTPHQCAVNADRQRLNQLLLNLLSNAVKYNRRGGSVCVTLDEDPVSHRATVRVTDTGLGIPAEKLARLFKPFERLGAEATGIEGTGLGLVVSRGLAAAMGGELGVTSEVDRGSTFSVDLHLADMPPTPTEADPPIVRVDPTVRGRVLYIEDNPSNVRLMERIFQRRAGVTLLTAPSGRTGIDLAHRTQPDAIFLDLHLPDMHGERVLRELRGDSTLREIPVAVLSADATPAQARTLKAAGAVAYLTKPLDIGKVLVTLDSLLSRPVTAAAADSEHSS